MRRAVRDVETAREQITAARASRVLQERKLDAEIKKFENGLSTNFEVLQFQTDLTTAESGELRSVVDYTKALVALKKAKVPSELHIFQTGGHGCGLRKTDETVTTWPAACERWLRTISALPKT